MNTFYHGITGITPSGIIITASDALEDANLLATLTISSSVLETSTSCFDVLFKQGLDTPG